MKLHNLLLTAALFLSAGAVFAKNDAKEILGDLSLTAEDSYHWDIVQKDGSEITGSMLKIVMVRMNGNSDKVDTGWRFKVGSYTDDGQSILYTSLSDLNGKSIDYDDELIKANMTSEQVNAVHKYAHGGFLFNIPVEDLTVAELGLVGKDQTEDLSEEQKANVESIRNTASSSDYKFYTVEGTNILYYGSITENSSTYPNNGAFFIVSLNTTYQEKEIGAGGGSGSNGQPLPAPIVTLLIALGFGAVLVYRRKQARA